MRMTGLFWFFGAEPNFLAFYGHGIRPWTDGELTRVVFSINMMLVMMIESARNSNLPPGDFLFFSYFFKLFRGQQEGKMKRRHMRCLQLILTDPKKEVSDWLCLQPCFEGRNNRAAAGPLMLRLSHSLRRRLTAATASLLSNRLFSLFSSLSRFFFRDN